MSLAEICTTPPPTLPPFLSLILHLLISLICCSPLPTPFYKTCTFMRPRNGVVCTKTSQDGRSITRVNTFQKRLLIGDVCMQIDMAQQDVSYSTLVKQCKHKAAVCDEESGCPSSSAGKNEKLVIPPLKNSFLLHHVEYGRNFLKVPIYEEKKVLLIFSFLFTLVLLLTEIYGEFVLMVKKDTRKTLKNTNVSFAVVPEISCQLYTL